MLYSKIRMKMSPICALAFAFFTGLLVGCGPSGSAFNIVVPPGIDLSGIWVLDKALSDAQPDRSKAQQRQKAAEIKGKSVNVLGSMFFAAQDFPVISADRISIEQDDESIGISYGDGQHRDLIWGLQKRASWKIDAGWERGRLIVQSMTSHTSGIERYQLRSDGEILLVEITIRTGGERKHLRRTFVRSH